jgi:hypothetical protein
MRDPGGRLIVTAAQFRLAAPGRDSAAGPADVQVSGGALVIAAAGGDLLRIPFAQITSLTQNVAYTVQLALPGGTVIELSRMGAMTTQLLAELHDGRADAIAAALRPVGPAAIFNACRGADPVELRVHDDALLVIGDGASADGASERVGFSFVSAVHTEEYVVTVERAGRPPLFLSRLGRRTGEFAELLAGRLTAARTRTAAFLGALVPGLDPVALGEAAGLLRDGVAVPAGVLDQIQPGLAATLADLAVRPERRAALAGLRERGPVALGFRQVMTAHRAAAGVTPWAPRPAAASGADHGNPAVIGAGLGGLMTAEVLAAGGAAGGGAAGGGLGGWGSAGMGPGAVLLGAVQPGAVLAGAVLAGEVAAAGMPFGAGGYRAGGCGGGGYGVGGDGMAEDYWALRALQGLDGGAGGGRTRPMTARPDTDRGSLVPETDDVAAVTVTGDHPAVLAFVLGSAGGRVVLEILNEPGVPTFVYQAAGPAGLAAVNQALDDSGFQPGAAAAPLLAGQVAHDEHWAAGLDELMAG